VAAWQFTDIGAQPILHKEPLQFEYVHLAQRSYK
jgi:succinate dehydrogenase / fumarate reductase flavoprotein subunit